MLGYDPETDRHRYNRKAHYRLYLSHRGEGAIVIHVQGFDYHDYDENHFLSNRAFDSEQEAEIALVKLREDAAKVLGLNPHYR